MTRTTDMMPAMEGDVTKPKRSHSNRRTSMEGEGDEDIAEPFEPKDKDIAEPFEPKDIWNKVDSDGDEEWVEIIKLELESDEPDLEMDEWGRQKR